MFRAKIIHENAFSFHKIFLFQMKKNNCIVVAKNKEIVLKTTTKKKQTNKTPQHTEKSKTQERQTTLSSKRTKYVYKYRIRPLYSIHHLLCVRNKNYKHRKLYVTKLRWLRDQQLWLSGPRLKMVISKGSRHKNGDNQNISRQCYTADVE